MAKINVIWQVDPELMLETDWLAVVLAKLDYETIHDGNLAIVADNAIVVTRGYPINSQSLKLYLKRFAEQGFAPAGVIHLSDEYFKAPVDFYSDAAFVLRNFHRPDVAHLPNVYFLPLGYKRGYGSYNQPKPLENRQYRWFFAGQLGGKLSRRIMMKQAEMIPGGLAAISENFAGSQRFSFAQYVAAMGNTVFALAPAGNKCVETFRIYEAIESGAVPIVEDVSPLTTLKSIVKELLTPREYRNYRIWGLTYWRIAWLRMTTKSYWLDVYGADFPCIRCTHWGDLQTTINTTQPEALAAKIQTFWANYKLALQNQVVDLTNTHFPALHNQIESYR